MQKLIKFFRKNIFVLAILLLSVPSFYRALQFGIHSMQDFHLFRLYEFDKCVKVLQIPCRWAPDAGLGYGEPLFNFYGQLPYAFGELLHLTGISFIDSLKILFVLSLAGSGISMFFLARRLWKNDWAAVIASMMYIYAPYRAVDVWVRGALPEALSFVIFPLIILAIEKRNLLGFGLLTSALILSHNLSALMFLPVMAIWIFYRRFWKAIPAGTLAIGVSAFYILPVIFESKFINLASTTQEYFDFRAHFLTLKQIFLNFFWGYGGSTWGDGDGLNLSVGLVQWALPVAVLVLTVWQKKLKENKIFSVLLALGIFYLFLTHNKSTFIWESLPFMAFIQFPWRFLGVAVFCLALASGFIANLISRKLIPIVLPVIILILLALNFSFFREDIWYRVDDSYFTTGAEWDRQRTASIGDFWPDFGHEIPDKPSDGKYINYFPGWIGAEPDENGLIPAEGTTLTDTPVRRIGNIISLVCTLLFLFLLLR
ncbi:MAG: hypothetical protein UX13_C0021G0009 [Candidatus Woesebacteria bacterium GW2011_GWB1_45_5]|uniref:Membrane protein 6-pyruvoyl-tetrahydropterin synthase-related domain-containing protein n=1 Tax=Candidatus Woesebacteria bacterium GW2011_GWB1_45_5 TaxID=1618581 RepID=A0A0G1MPG7_9BACT|nr:MAG: hypothetical protein UX13_C0021G0009 [Candidatus Woesebacteria bacterium GW2011_GWB1_45_5]